MIFFHFCSSQTLTGFLCAACIPCAAVLWCSTARSCSLQRILTGAGSPPLSLWVASLENIDRKDFPQKFHFSFFKVNVRPSLLLERISDTQLLCMPELEDGGKEMGESASFPLQCPVLGGLVLIKITWGNWRPEDLVTTCDCVEVLTLDVIRTQHYMSSPPLQLCCWVNIEVQNAVEN